MDFNTWGNVYLTDDNIFNSNNKQYVITTKRSKHSYRLEVVSEFTNKIIFRKNGRNVFAFTDIRQKDDPLNTFVRVFRHQTHYINNGKINKIEKF
jgi:hypothetical protein